MSTRKSYSAADFQNRLEALRASTKDTINQSSSLESGDRLDNNLASGFTPPPIPRPGTSLLDSLAARNAPSVGTFTMRNRNYDLQYTTLNHHLGSMTVSPASHGKDIQNSNNFSENDISGPHLRSLTLGQGVFRSVDSSPPLTKSSFLSRIKALTSEAQPTVTNKAILHGDPNQSLDFVFLVDITNSMQPVINAVYEKLDAILDGISQKYSGLPARAAFVGYRDTSDNDKLVVADFTSDPEYLKRTLRSVYAFGGGGDGPEDVFSGLEAVTRLSWRGKVRIMLHVADAPCHGSRFHGGIYKKDMHPDGDPEGRTAEELLRTIFEKRVKYIFLRLQWETDGMICEFNKIAAEYGLTIDVRTLQSDVADFVPQVVGSIIESIKAQRF